jgi:hypothetical protein
LQAQLQSDLDDALKRKDKERTLIFKLQTHIRKLLEKDLQDVIDAYSEKENEINDKDQQIGNILSQYEEDMQ